MRWLIAIIAAIGVFACGPTLAALTGLVGAASGGGAVTTFAVINSGGSSISNKTVSFVQPFASGDMPSGQYPVIYDQTGVTAYTTQVDNCSTWQDGSGSTKQCTLSFVEPDTITAGSNKTYTIKKTASAPSTTCATSTAQIQAATTSAFLYKFSGADLSPDTFDANLNDVLANGVQWGVGQTGWGTSPLRGWEYSKKGPVVCEIHWFKYLQRESDNAFHKWLKAEGWVRFEGSGTTPCPCSLGTFVKEANIWGGIATATVGASTEPKYVYQAELFNNGSRLYAWGGANDPNVTSLTAGGGGAFNHAGTCNGAYTCTTVTMPSNSTSWINAGNTAYNVANGATAVPVSFSGAGLPAGLSSAGYYWIGRFSNGYPFGLGPTQRDIALAASGASSYTQTTTDGSGTVTMTPYTATFYAEMTPLYDADAQRIWIDAAGAKVAAPTIIVAHNFDYLTQKTKATLPYCSNSGTIGTSCGTMIALTGPATTTYSYQTAYNWHIDASGDSPGDERIGPMPNTCTLSLFNPTDAVAYQNCRVLALGWARWDCHLDNELTGRIPILNNTSYTGMGTAYPQASAYPGNGVLGFNNTGLVPGQTMTDLNAEDWTSTACQNSHAPAPYIAPFLMTGEPEWLAQAPDYANQQYSMTFKTTTSVFSETQAGTTYYGVSGTSFPDQPRGGGWALRVLDFVNYFIPDSDPSAQYWHDFTKNQADWMQALYTGGGLPANEIVLAISEGYINRTIGGTYPFNEIELWMDDYFSMEWMKLAWEGEYSNFAAHATFWATESVGRGDAASPTVGCIWAAGQYSINPFVGGDSSQPLEPTWGAVYSQVANNVSDPQYSRWAAWRTAGGCPTSGLFTVDAVNLPIGGEWAPWLATLGMASALGINIGTDPATLYSTTRSRTNTAYTSYGTPAQSYPGFWIGPLGITN